ncbi:hypothetical protein K4F52_002467 [Lecanicillium sp. MT-2017a]|nr:hypothetical protein K4F52_002467 [Lecanicillium sp. MT-2017a]
MLHGVDTRYRPRSCLYHLALTCKIFRDLAIPKLYEVCNLNKSPVALLRSLIKSPANAACIKKVILSLDGTPAADRIFSAEDAALFNSVLKRKVKPHTVLLLPKAGSYSTRLKAGDLQSAIAAAFATILVAVARNVQVVVSSMGPRLAEFCPGAFPRIECIAVHHWSEQGGFGLHKVEGLLRGTVLSPNAQRFVGFAMRIIPEAFRYSSIRELLLSHCMLEAKDFRLLPRVFPNLEILGYEGGGYRDNSLKEPTPRELWCEIVKYKSTLKILRLQYDERRYKDERLSEEDLMGSLACMEVLHTIQIHARYLYRNYTENEPIDDGSLGITTDEQEYYRQSIARDRIRQAEEAKRTDESSNDDEGIQFDGYAQEVKECVETIEEPNRKRDQDDNTRLASFLPKSIEKLTIIDFASNEMQDVMQVLEVSKASFPHMTEINLPGIDNDGEDRDWIVEDCEYFGIKCSFEATPFNTYGGWVI